MPEKPIPDDDPIVNKSLAPHYVVAVIILMASLFWALWDEDFGQRPWKSFQQEWKTRYSAFLKNAHSQSSNSQKDVETEAGYQAVKLAYDQASQRAAARTKEINEKLRELAAHQGEVDVELLGGIDLLPIGRVRAHAEKLDALYLQLLGEHEGDAVVPG